MEQQQFPTEMVTLPSKGLLYPEESPLKKGEIEMKYMTAREEDILTNQNLIENGTVIDKLLQSLIITPINYSDLLIGDKNAVLVAARILGYGKDYEFDYNGEKIKVDLKESTHKVKTNLGKNVSFKTIKRDGYLKDNDGKFILDENDKKTPRYIETRVQGHFVIDELEDGFYKVTRGVHYTEHYLCSEFIELD